MTPSRVGDADGSCGRYDGRGKRQLAKLGEVEGIFGFGAGVRAGAGAGMTKGGINKNNVNKSAPNDFGQMSALVSGEVGRIKREKWNGGEGGKGPGEGIKG